MHLCIVIDIFKVNNTIIIYLKLVMFYSNWQFTVIILYKQSLQWSKRKQLCEGSVAITIYVGRNVSTFFIV